MCKKIVLVVIALALIIVMGSPSKRVFAANKEIKTVDAIQENGKLIVSGEVEEGMLAVAVQVLDQNNNLVKLETGAVDSNNKYKVEITVPEGKYIIKVADYDGGNTITKNIPEETQKTDSDSKEETKTTNNEEIKADNPKTGDNIIIAVSVLIIACVGVLLTIKLNKKHKAKK